MDFISTRLPYRATGSFSNLVLDYIDGSGKPVSFAAHTPSIAGIGAAIEERRKFNTNRKLLADRLKSQYKDTPTHANVTRAINSLLEENTFTVTSAHQNNIFTGPLYFIYKIFHSIKLAEKAKEAFPQNNFVPVFYIGSEDADLAELDHIHIGGEKLTWHTDQQGAVGRMKIDDGLITLIRKMEGQLGVFEHGKEIIALLEQHYRKGSTLQEATFSFVNDLFGEFGLVILLPDNPDLKSLALSVFEDDLFNNSASPIVLETAEKLQANGYKIQASPREINLFYLLDNSRERIEMKEENGQRIWAVLNSDIKFTARELKTELANHPERFSPNVILRCIYQEIILPNVAFIGGGGETAYWLQLKKVFEFYKVPFPVLFLRNSFLVIENKWKEKMSDAGISIDDLFLPTEELFNKLVLLASSSSTRLDGSLPVIEELYEKIKQQAASIDSTLSNHVDALKKKAVTRLLELEKKMLRAEKRKNGDLQGKVTALRTHLFPGDGLQERYENICYYYAKYGRDFLHMLYRNSLSTGQEFVILTQS